MQSEFQLSAIHGQMHTGGNLIFSKDGLQLFSPVLNNITSVHLRQGRNATFRCCNSGIQCFDLSPDGDLLIVIGSRGLGMFYSIPSRVVLDTISFPPHCSVSVVKFSPCGKFVAVALENTLQIYTAPAERVVTFHGCHRIENVHAALTLPIRSIEWTADSEHLLLAGDDARIKIIPRSAKNQKGIPTLENNLIGHRSSVRLARFLSTTESETGCVSVSVDNTVILWSRTPVARKELMALVAEQKLVAKVEEYDEDDPDAVPPSFIEVKKIEKLKKQGVKLSSADDGLLPDILRYAFEVKKKFLFQKNGTVSVADYHPARALLALGYSSGTFAIHSVQEADLSLVHVLSISSQTLTACRFNPNGDHVAFGAGHLKQLFVWDWKSESYVLKEQSHYYDISRVALTADGSSLLSGGEDGKLKAWNTATGQCYATFAEHSAAITGIAVNSVTNAAFTCSKDGTLRAFDLVRYRNFRIFHPPNPTQFSCLALEPSGEVVVAGSTLTNDIYLWAVQTGVLIDVFSGHEAPVTALAFHPGGTTLVSGSIDKSLVVWDVFNNTGGGEKLKGDSETVETTSEVLAISYSRNGKFLAVLLLSSEVIIYDSSVPSQPIVMKTFRTSFDATGGWTNTTGPNSANANNHFTSLALSPDGQTVLLGGESRWLAMYQAAQGFLLKKWPVTTNLDVQGAEEQYQYRKQTEAGVIDDIDVDDDDIHLRNRKLIEMPGSKHQHFATGKRKTMLTARTMHLTFAEHGRDFIAATTDGLLHFSMDVSHPRFAPLNLTADMTTESINGLLAEGKYVLALCGALQLQDEKLGRRIMRFTPKDAMAVCVSSVPSASLGTFIVWVAQDVASSTALEHSLLWARAVLTFTNDALFGTWKNVDVQPALKLLHRAMHEYDRLHTLVDDNTHKLRFLSRSLACAAGQQN